MSDKKILIIEDDLALAKTLRNVLMLNNYQADIASSGAEGIQKAYEYCPDLILCDINMKPIDGYQVFNILKDSILTSRIPFIFITGRSELNDIRIGLELGVDDYIVKPFENEDLLKSIKVRLDKYEKLVNIGKNNYKALLNLSPYGVFVFDGETIYETNRAFLEVTGLSDSEVKNIKFENLLTPKQYNKIEGPILKCINGLSDNFQEDIKIKNADGDTEKFRLHVTPSQKYSGFTLLIGLLSPLEHKTESTAPPVEYKKLVNILEEEKITISGDLAHKLHKAFTPSQFKYQQDQSDVLVGKNIFSKREQEVLTLSCKGLPIKMIADQLNISDRTVEKHRANLMEKTGAKNIVEVIIYALKNDLVDI
ncbi:response regulator [uncultured Sunxiuqinia sp.]|uniref:response regulator n=1 Tax=uncultured Sunxiuqinia sp. TaxID=1573825 RepID=UPI002AA86834|nr:response regulator [uncultured Sunxiuqinia sp.]